MINEPVHRLFKIPLDEWIKMVPNELEKDAIGLWQIIPVGKNDFSLQGDELVRYVKKTLLAILKRGAMPVRGASDGVHLWTLANEYGNNADQIAETIIADWLASGSDPDPSGLWFALPKIYQAPH